MPSARNHSRFSDFCIRHFHRTKAEKIEKEKEMLSRRQITILRGHVCASQMPKYDANIEQMSWANDENRAQKTELPEHIKLIAKVQFIIISVSLKRVQRPTKI